VASLPFLADRRISSRVRAAVPPTADCKRTGVKPVWSARRTRDLTSWTPASTCCCYGDGET